MDAFLQFVNKIVAMRSRYANLVPTAMNHREYLSKIGAKGGKSHKPGRDRMREIARLRWQKAKQNAPAKNNSK